MVLSERHSESVRFVRIERHVPHVGPACDFYPDLQRVKRLLPADQRDERWYGNIDESQKKHRAKNTALRNSRLDEKRR